MDIITILVLLVLVAFSATGFVYSGMDKQRMRAMVYAKRMKTYLDSWILNIFDQIKSPDFDAGTKEKLQPLADEYFSGRKRKNPLKTVSQVKSISSILRTAENSILQKGKAEPKANSLAAVLRPESNDDLDEGFAETDDYDEDTDDKFRFLRYEYNRYAEKLNSRLEKPIPSLVGKICFIKRLEVLEALPKIPNCLFRES